MKKIVLSIVSLSCGIATVFGQAITDEVTLGAGYANQAFYSLRTGEVDQKIKNSWDLAFDASGMGSTIRINDAKGVKLWNYPHGNEFGNAVDTTGITTWQTLNNTDTSWNMGAFNHKNNPNDPFDLGWGQYSTITHAVNGNRLYIIQVNGSTYKQIHIDQLLGGSFEFSYADLDGTNQAQATVTKSNFSGKNFGYYSLENNEVLDLEPLAEAWDLLFTQYVTTLPNGMAYGVSGVLSNKDIHVAKVQEVENPASYVNWEAHDFSHYINSVGYDWKSFNSSTFSFDIADDLVFFIQDKNTDIWKLIFTGFGGQSNGKYEFTLEQLTTANLTNHKEEPVSLALYPNPSNGNELTVLYNIPASYSDVAITIYDYTGRVHYQNKVVNQGGLTQLPIHDANLKAGGYLINLSYGSNSIQQKLIVQN